MPEKKDIKKKSAQRTAARTAAAKKRTSTAAKRKSANHGTKKRKSARKKKKSSWWAWPVTFVMLLVLIGVGVAFAQEYQHHQEFLVMRETLDRDGFYEGVSIDGTSVTGRSYDEVYQALRAQDEERRAALTLNLVYGSQSWTITAEDLDYHSDYRQVVTSAYQLGRQGSLQQRYAQIYQAQNGGAAYTVDYGFDEKLLRIITDDIASSLAIECIDATIDTFNTNTLSFTFTKEQIGNYVDPEALYQSALTALNSGVGNQVIQVQSQTLYPAVTQAELKDNCGLIAMAETRMYDTGKNRRTNISLALGILTGVRVNPGETFSFNGTVGERTAARGFKEASAFSEGLTIDELGGGICQVSTTLYNAVVKSDLRVTVRNPHSKPVRYVDKGKDAAVSWPGQDFQFINTSSQPVFIVGDIVTDSKGNMCVDVWIYGLKLPNGEYIQLVAEVVEETDASTIPDEYRQVSTLPTGQIQQVATAHNGYKTVSYKIRFDAQGNEISRESFWKSTYLPGGNIYNVGR